MSDLISREALIKELETFDEEFEFHIDEVYVLIANAPAIEQGEAVTKLWESLGRWSAFLAKNGEQAELSPPSWLIDAVKNATSPISQNEHQEAVGFIDEADEGIFGDVQNGIAEGLCKVGDLLYTSPPKQIPDGWKLIGKVSEMGVVWHKQNPHAHPVGTEFYAVLPTTSETNTEVGE